MSLMIALRAEGTAIVEFSNAANSWHRANPDKNILYLSMEQAEDLAREMEHKTINNFLGRAICAAGGCQDCLKFLTELKDKLCAP